MNLGFLKSKSKGANPDRVRQRVSTPIVLQMHATECGAACLGIVLSYFGRWAPLTELREKCEVSRDGSSAASILRAAKHYGLECSGLSLRADSLRLLQLPAILFWQFSHFVVLEGYDEHFFYINDPSVGHRKVPASEFNASYSGIALRLNRGPDFTKGGESPSLFEHLRNMLAGSWPPLLAVLACGLLTSAIALVIPASLTILVDSLLANNTIFVGLILVLLIAGILVYLLSLIKQRVLSRLAVKLAIVGYDRGFSKLLRLPVEFFHHRLVGDLTDRVASIDRITKQLTERFLVLVIDMTMSVILLIAMFLYDVSLTLIVLLLGTIHLLLARFLQQVQGERTQTLKREQGILIGLGMQMLSHRDSLRMTGADDRFFARWTGQQARELRARHQAVEPATLNLAFPGFIGILRAALILAIGGTMVIAGQISLGLLVGFYVLAEMFLTPISKFLNFNDERRALETDFQRFDDIAKTATDPVFKRRNRDSESIQTFNGRLQLTGRLELRDVTFGYNKSRPPLLKNFNLVIEPGQRVAIVGASGSGKSTLARLVAGIYQPISGDILFDGHSRHEIPLNVLHRSISMVDQDVVLFSASLRDNITLWNPAIPDEVVFKAARDACIHEEILVRQHGYSTLVAEGGTNFSGGQRQRIEIARALVSNPSLIILDEATSALDAATEEDVDSALRRRGIACLIIAHRLSTVRDCDQIVVLEKGSEIQRGTHDELMLDEDGAYFKLVRSAR
ncbi:MAG: ATP-binding cassette domain-containing protein [Gammaproteobacteria bacterium]|nr:ATP-binding cassette domain-containing protein [Gammaproteobacteria bacterium]